jgi:transposase
MTFDARRDQAVQLRLAGLSRSQIADALGLSGGGKALTEWLRDVPPPEWTRRPRAKDGIREIAVAMRKEGRSYREIREEVGVAKSTLSLWLRDVPLTEEQQLALARRCPATASRRARATRASAAQRRERIQAEAAAQVVELSESELFVAGVVAYWAEGAKNKPWRTGTRVRFLNSDDRFVTLFLRWLALIGVTEDRICFRLHIHESADIPAALRFWSEQLGVDQARFLNTSVKRHNPKTVRTNVGTTYHGCLCVEVRQSAALNLQIDGWCQGLGAALPPPE